MKLSADINGSTSILGFLLKAKIFPNSSVGNNFLIFKKF